MSFTLAQTLPIRTWPRPDRRVPAAAAWPDAVRSGPVMRFVRNNQHHLLFHRLTLPEQVQPLRRACTGGIAAGEGGTLWIVRIGSPTSTATPSTVVGPANQIGDEKCTVREALLWPTTKTCLLKINSHSTVGCSEML